MISRKSWGEAERLRKIGNTKYAKCLPLEALKAYNEALSFLPAKTKPGDTLLALLLANRSLVLHQLGQHRAALHDMKRSLESGYPQSSAYKLYSRQASCFSSLGQEAVAARCLERARAAADLLPEEEREKALSYIRERSEKVSQTGTGSDLEVTQLDIIRNLSSLVSGEKCSVPAGGPPPSGYPGGPPAPGYPPSSGSNRISGQFSY